MFHKEKQVVLTYLTGRWIWLPFCFILLMTGGSYVAVHNGVMTGIWTANGLGFPVCMGLIWLMMIAKWQFANPRARLLPNFARPHLLVLGTLFLFILVANPLCFSLIGGLSTPGCMAFTLLLSGGIAWGSRPGGSWLTLPSLVIFFSGVSEIGKQFWFVTPNRFDTLHEVLAVAGGAMVVAWLWHLSRLTEEMDDYQVLPMGRPGGFSRMERAEQRKVMGRVMARRGIVQSLSDRWHDQIDQLPAGPESRSRRMQYGFGRISGVTRALLTGFAFTLYCIFLNQVIFIGGNEAGPTSYGIMIMTSQWALVAPAVAAGLMMIQRLPRMAQEILRPATRTEYIDSLFLSLAQQSLWLWLAVQLGLLAIGISTGTFAEEHLPSLAVSYTLVSLAAQLPTFGFSLEIVRKVSTWRFLLGLYAAMIFQSAVLGVWWLGRKQIGDLIVVPVLFVILLAAGAKTIVWARRRWLEAELA